MSAQPAADGEFGGLVAVVTGGASGIGAATARILAQRGARVAVLDVNVDGLADGIAGYAVDVRDRAGVRAAVDSAAADLGGIDVVVNSAGIGAIGTVEANDDDEWARLFDINVTGTARVVAAALPHLRRSSAASVVNVSSVAASNGIPDRAVYSATKGAVMSLTFAMAVDHVREGIRVNCVRPGTAATPWVERMLQKAADPVAERAALDARQAIGRLVSAEEVAGAIVYLASPLSGSTTGTALDVDGGLTTLRLRPQ